MIGASADRYRIALSGIFHHWRLLFFCPPLQPVPGPAGLQVVINRENDIKAAYLYNFCKYVEWPADHVHTKQKVVIAVLGSSPVYNSLVKITHKKMIQNRELVVEKWSSMKDFDFCHVLFVPEDHDDELLKMYLQKFKEKSILIVGEQDGFTKRAGIINFFVESNKIRFEINDRIAESRNLKISSKLMQLGRRAD
ncbi:MAG: YfiR family protein [Planctomycetaceae bacterium]